MLVSKYNVAFRTSHKIVGALVKALIDSKQTLNDVTPQLLQKVAMEAAGVKLTVKNEDIVSCTNLRKVIETYKVQGGPSPAEVERALKTHQKTLADNKKAIADTQQTTLQPPKTHSTKPSRITLFQVIKKRKA